MGTSVLQMGPEVLLPKGEMEIQHAFCSIDLWQWLIDS